MKLVDSCGVIGRLLHKAIEYARKMGAITAQEALAVGINWILAPVVDVNNNPANPVINIRSVGEMPEIVSKDKWQQHNRSHSVSYLGQKVSKIRLSGYNFVPLSRY